MAKKLKIPKKRTKWRLFKLSSDNANTEILGAAHMEIFGNSKISIDGCLGVYEYKDTYIKLRIYKGAVIICGSNLNIVYFENRLITVCGKICDVEFV